MDIVLNTTFNNPRLPVVPIAGFTDDFNRPAGPLGVTVDGKVWEYRDNPWQLTGDGAATGLSSGGWAAVDALTADGILTGVVATKSTSGADQRFGLALRVVDRNNYLWLGNNTAGTLTLYATVDGSTVSSNPISGKALADGTVVAAELDGTTVTVRLDGVTVHTQTVTHHALATRHGLYSHTSADAKWDSIQFTP